MKRTLCVTLLAWLLCAPFGQAYDIPPIPDDLDWLQDGVGLVTAADRQAIHEAMERSGEVHGTAIMVVTIDRMAAFVEYESSPAIEDLAREWFDSWEIGRAEYNTGILLLVAKGDRKARIELGADWGRRWDAHTQRIMDQQIVAHFKRGDFSGGIREGVQRLEAMAALGPDAPIPEPGLWDSVRSSELVRKLDTYQPLPLWLATLSLLAGVGMVIGGVLVSDYDLAKWLFIGGAVLILVAVSLYLMMFVFGMFSRGSGGGGSGFGGGGFSGGGGASGSW